jgi:membrane fusion protein, multidrug efflux system
MRRIAMTGLIGILFIGGCRQKPGNGAGLQAVPVKTAPVLVRQLSEPIRTSGFLSSESEMKLSFKTGGIIDDVFARDGERVRKGQILATLKLDEIRGMVEQAKNGYEKAKRDFARAQNLYRDSVATLEQIQDAQTGLNVAKAMVDIAEFNLTHSAVIAPCDGRILKRLAEANELIGPGYPALIFGTAGSEWIVKVGATDRDVVRIAVGDSASVALDAFPGSRFAATVRTVGAAPDPMSGVFEVELSVHQGPRTFINGLMADAGIFPSRKREYRVIPFEALVDVSDMRGYVYAVSSDLTARKLPVTIGFLTDGIAAVELGLEKTDRVVSEGAAYLSDGMPVRQVEN